MPPVMRVLSERANAIIAASDGVAVSRVIESIKEETGVVVSRSMVRTRKAKAGLSGSNKPSLDKHHAWKKGVSEKVWKDGRVVVRTIVDGKVKWRRKNAVLWEEMHGPIPEGMRLVCIGDKSSDDPSNWMLMHRGAAIFAMALGPIKMKDADHELKPSLIALAELKYKIKKKGKRND